MGHRSIVFRGTRSVFPITFMMGVLVDGHLCTWEFGRECIARYREKPLETKVQAVSFDRGAYDRILAQPGCTGVRNYLARTPEGEMTLVMVGITADGANMSDGEVAELGKPCPPFCDVPSSGAAA